MKTKKLLTIITVFIIGAGCWSARLKAEQNVNMENAETTESNVKNGFFKNLPKDFEQPTDDVGKLILREYGAVYVARGGAVVNRKVGFKDESEVTVFQNSVRISSQLVGGKKIELQAPAMSDLLSAIKEIKANNLPLSPRSTNPSRRSFKQTVGNWNGNVNSGFAHWIDAKGLSIKERDHIKSERDRIKKLDVTLQVPEILRLEQKKIYFSTWWNKSIIYSVAPPGMSQHNLMLALDILEFEKPKVREILARHGWYQTIPSDEPHFTYLGVTTENELEALGLKKQMVKATNGGIRPFWMPDI